MQIPRSPDLKAVTFHLNTLMTMYRFMVALEFPFSEHSDICVTKWAQKACEKLVSLCSNQVCCT